MSKISYPRIVTDVADAYRTASGTSGAVKYGELAEKIEELSNTADNFKSEIYRLAGEISTDTAIAPEISVRLDISFAELALTGTVGRRAYAGDTLGLACFGCDIESTTKQWQNFSEERIPANMIVSEAGETLCILSGRRYVKSRSGKAYVGYMCNSGGYSGPLLVSKVSADAVIFNGGGPDQYSAGSFIYNGETYWYSSGGYWMGGNINDSSSLNRYKIPVMTTMENGALMLMDEVSNYSWQDIEGEIGDTYTVTAEDTRVRCVITGSGDLTGKTNSDTAIIE